MYIITPQGPGHPYFATGSGLSITSLSIRHLPIDRYTLIEQSLCLLWTGEYTLIKQSATLQGKINGIP